MKLKTLTFLATIIITSEAFAQTSPEYQADPGIRIDSATTRKAVMHNDTLFVYYGYQLNDGTTTTSETGLAISVDAPDYNFFTKVNINDYPLYNMYLLPDGITRRKYYKDSSGDFLTSDSSTDDWTSTPDITNRYDLHSSDEGMFGVSTVVVDAEDNVHLYYMGDLWGEDNIRHAMSADEGDSFTFQSNDVCGDLGGLPGNYSYIDPDVVMLDDNSIRLIVINRNGTIVPTSNTYPANWTVHSFLSTDNGMTFTKESTPSGDDTIAYASEFLDTNVRSLHDPKIVQLPDGRIKFFLNGSTFADDSLHWDIYSFTSMPDISSVEEIEKTSWNIYPNPANDRISIQGIENKQTYEIMDMSGRTVLSGNHCQESIDISMLEKGMYVLMTGEESKRFVKL